jgi:hypothetical protein
VTREQLIAAEIYGYSFDNYEDHLGIENVRYEELMPEAAKTLERAANEGWPTSKVAEVLKVAPEEVPELAAAFDRARQIVDADNPAELFRNAVRFSIQDAVNEGLSDAESIESLVTQICYRAADLAFVLKAKGETLSRYSRHLRKESGVEYYEGYFDEPEEAV